MSSFEFMCVNIRYGHQKDLRKRCIKYLKKNAMKEKE